MAIHSATATETQENPQDVYPVISVRVGPTGRRAAENLAAQANKPNAAALLKALLVHLEELVGDSPFDVRKLTYDPDIKIERIAPQGRLRPRKKVPA